MIEFLIPYELDKKGTTRWFFDKFSFKCVDDKDVPLCDALWQAVKENL
jgi:hypothetical protein